MLAGLLSTAVTDPKLTGLLTHISEPYLHITGIAQSRPWTVAAIAQRAPVLLVTATGREAEDVTAELRAMMGESVAWFPSWETLPHERLSPGVDIVGQRAEVLHKLPKLKVVVAAARAFCQPILSSAPGRDPLVVEVDRESSFEDITRDLVFRGYSHVDMVGKRGEFATRGGIIDIFPTTLDYPVRIEFWGDEVTDIRQFSVADQRTIPDIEVARVEVYPCRELLVTDEVSRRWRCFSCRFAMPYPADGNKSAAKIDPTKVTAKKIVASKRFLSRPRRVV